MFVVSLTYKVELVEIERYLANHIEYLDHHYALGHFLASGRKVPRTGGIILVNVESKNMLNEILSNDPFKINGIADYDIIEFIPTKTSKELSSFQQN